MDFYKMQSLHAILILCLSVAVTIRALKGDQLWRVKPHNQQNLNVLKHFQETKIAELWSQQVKLNESILMHVAKENIGIAERLLSSSKVDFDVTIESMQHAVEEQKKRVKRTLATDLDDFDYSIYHTYEEIQQWMNFVIERYSFITKEQIGVTYEGRSLNLLKIQKSSTSGMSKPIIWMDALIHAREWITTASVMFLWNEILTKSENQWLLNEFNWYLIPIINVDGYIYTWTNEDTRLWRKTRSDTASSICIGIDGNRNWNAHWSESSSDDNCAYDYHGAFSTSESEIRHLTQYILEQKDAIKGLLTIHSYGQLILYPYCYTQGEYTPDLEEQHSLAVNMRKAMYEVHQTNYTAAQGAEGLNYDWSGSTIDWSYDKAGIQLSYTIELRDKGMYGFILPPDQIIPTGEELLAGIKVFASRVKERE